MSRAPAPSRMPPEVRAARVVLLVQAAANVLFALTVAVLMRYFAGDPRVGAVMTWSLVFYGGTAILVAVLAFAVRSRRPWVRYASFGVEGVWAAFTGYDVVDGGASTVVIVLGLVLPLVVAVLLTRRPAADWFARRPGPPADQR
jgi:Na+-driven multidrug efflux pump